MEPAELSPQPVESVSGLQRALKWLFCIWVLALAVYQFSENTADPDLWGHTLFGQDYLVTGKLAKTEPYSWTARGTPWINHEVLSEVALGAAHQWMGGTGLLFLKMAIGLLTFGVALHVGSSKLPWPTRAFAWIFGAVALVEISFGFAPRPQIFTALAMACTLWILKKVHDGVLWPSFLTLVLFALWINTHGGVIAGLGLLGLAAVVTTVQFLARKSTDGSFSTKTLLGVWLSFLLGAVALLINPWGVGLVKWLIESVLWLRPEIEEWNPTPLNWDHAALFILIALTLFAWIYSRRRKAWWEFLACAAFAILALRSVRNTPLFAIVALATVPSHLADACLRFRHLISHREELFAQRSTLSLLVNFFWITLVGICAAMFFLRKEHPLTIEVPKKQYPVAAINFIRTNQIQGNLLVFFDWGEMCLWELPDSPVSIDGRLDTCYPREVITNHWQVYNALPHDNRSLDLNKADFALMPSNLQGALALSKQPGWRAVYVDDTAAVLVRDAARFPLLPQASATNATPGAVGGSRMASIGRVAFPDKPSLRIARTQAP